MAFIDDTINTEEFAGLTPLQKSQAAKDSLPQFFEENPAIRDNFLASDQDGRQNFANNYRQALFNRHGENFSRKRVTEETIEVPSGRAFPIDVETGERLPATKKITTEKVENLPILDTDSELLLERIKSGEISPETAIGGKTFSELNEDEIEQYTRLVTGLNAFKQANYLEEEELEPFIQLGEQILTERRERPRPATQLQAFVETGLALETFRDIGRFAGEVVTRTGDILKGVPAEETEATLKRLREESEPFSPLEKAVRGETIETLKTAGALTFAITTGVAGGMAINALPRSKAIEVGFITATTPGTTAVQRLSMTALLEGGIGLQVGEELPSIASELLDIDPDSLGAKVLNFAEGSLLGTLGTLLPKANRASLREDLKSIFSNLRTQQGIVSKLELPGATRQQKRLTGAIIPKVDEPIDIEVKAIEAGEPQLLIEGEQVKQLEAAIRLPQDPNIDDLLHDANIVAEKFGINLDDAQALVKDAHKAAVQAQEELFAQPIVNRERVIDPQLEADLRGDIGQMKLKDKLAQEEVLSRLQRETEVLNQQQIGVVVDGQKEVTAIDRAINRERSTIPREAQPVTPTERRLKRAGELKADFRADAKTALMEEAEVAIERQQLFNEVRLDNTQVAIVNNINGRDLTDFTLTEKRILTNAAAKTPEIFQKNLDDILNRKLADPALDEAGRARLSGLRQSLTKPVERKVVAEETNLAKATERLAADPSEIAKLTKTQINELLAEPVPNVKNVGKQQLMDRFDIERARSIIKESRNMDVPPREPGFDVDGKLREGNEIQLPKADEEFTPRGDSVARFKAAMDDPANPNITRVEPEAPGVVPKTAKVEGVDLKPLDPATPQAVKDAAERILRRISKGFTDPTPGKGIGGFFSPENFRDLTILGAEVMTRGFNRMSEWAKEMVDQFGLGIKHVLGDIWEASKKFINDPLRPIINTANAFDDALGITKNATQQLNKRFAQNKIVKGLDAVFSPISTRIGRISKSVKGSMLKFEAEVRITTAQSLNEMKLFLDSMSRLRGADRKTFEQVNTMLMNGDISSTVRFIRQSDLDSKLKDNLVGGIEQMRRELDNMFRKAKDAGLDIGHQEDYVPRIISDYNGWLKSKGIENSSALEKIWAEERRRLGRPLSIAEEAEVANRFLMRDAVGAKTGFERKRVINQVSQEDSAFYAPATESIYDYVIKMNDRIKKNELFGKHNDISLAKNEKTEIVTLADGSTMKRVVQSPPALVEFTDESIGNFVRKSAPELKGEELQELTDLIKARFAAGEGTMNDWLQAGKNIGYIATMGKFTNSITQIGDLWASVWKSPKEFLGGMKQASIFATDDAFTTVELGLTRIMEEHASNPMFTAKVLDKLFKAVGLQAIDRFGKETFMNAAWLKAQKTAKGIKGEKALSRFVAEHNELFGEDFTKKLISDLKAGNRSFEVDAFVFKEISGVQPISKLEMPEVYLNSPNGRMFYMLKTYALKQLDIARREGLDEMLDAVSDFKTGNRVESSKKAANGLMKIGLVAAGGPLWEATTSDVLKDAVRGKPIDPQSIGDAAFANFLRFFFLNKHVIQNFEKDRDPFLKAVEAFFPPIISIGDKLWHDSMKALEGDLSLQNAELTYQIPFIGDAVFWRGATGKKRIEKMSVERAKGESFLFDNLDDILKDVKKERAANKEELTLDIEMLNDLPNQQEKFKFIQNVFVNNPKRGTQVMNAFKKQELDLRSGLTPAEREFRKQPAEAVADRLAQIINRLPSPRAKQQFIREMRQKKILTKSVQARMNSQLLLVQ